MPAQSEFEAASYPVRDNVITLSKGPQRAVMSSIGVEESFTWDGVSGNNAGMTDQITRNEFNAEIKAIEARTDSKVAEIRGDIKALTVEMRSYMAEGRERDKRLELIATKAEKAAESASNIKGHLWAAVLAVILAIASSYFATQASNIGIMQLMTSAYQQGQSSPPPPPPAKK